MSYFIIIEWFILKFQTSAKPTTEENVCPAFEPYEQINIPMDVLRKIYEYMQKYPTGSKEPLVLSPPPQGDPIAYFQIQKGDNPEDDHQ